MTSPREDWPVEPVEEETVEATEPEPDVEGSDAPPPDVVVEQRDPGDRERLARHRDTAND